MSSIKRRAPADESIASSTTKRFRVVSTSSSKENVFDEPCSSHTKINATYISAVLQPTQKNSTASLQTCIIPVDEDKVKATTVSAPPAPKPPTATYNMDPSSRRAELAKDPSVQLIHSTPYLIYCRPCRQLVCLERRGTGYYAQNFASRHVKRDSHKRALAAWTEQGGHLKKAEDEEVQYKCVYWKENTIVKERVVELNEGVAAEAMMDMKAGEPKPGCGGRRATVDQSREEDMIEYLRRLQMERRGAAKSRK